MLRHEGKRQNAKNIRFYSQAKSTSTLMLAKSVGFGVRHSIKLRLITLQLKHISFVVLITILKR